MVQPRPLSNASPSEAEVTASEGRITVHCRESDGASVASELYATYPIRFQVTTRPNSFIATGPNNEDSCIGQRKQVELESSDKGVKSKALSAYLLDYGGGLVSGDSIHLTYNITCNASLLVTSQTTSKIFKCIPGRPSTSLITNVAIHENGLFVSIPQPTQCFSNSRSRQLTNVTLHSPALTSSKKIRNAYSVSSNCSASSQWPSILLVDWYTGGRGGELDDGFWNHDLYEATTNIYMQPLKEEIETPLSRKRAIPSLPTLQSMGFSPSTVAPISSSSSLVFRDTTKLSGGKGDVGASLARHMRTYNVVAMVILIGPHVKGISERFMQNFSLRKRFDILGSENSEVGMNTDCEDMIVSCGTFPLVKGCNGDKGVIVRIASMTLEKAARLLSEFIGTVDGHLEHNPFLEIVSVPLSISRNLSKTNDAYRNGSEEFGDLKENLSFGLIRHSCNSFPSLMIEDSGNSNRAPYKGCCDSLPPSKSLRGERYDEYVSPMPIYQLIDSNAPTGGFAHSNTVEAAFQLGLITKSVDKRNGLCSPRSPYYRSLKLHVYDVLLNTVSTMVPYVVSACDLLYCISAKDSSLTTVGNSNQLYQVCDRFQCIDEELGATLTSHVSRRASSVQGLGILRAFGRTFPSMSEILSSIKTRLLDSSVTDLDDVDSDGGRAGHAATCFAAVCGLAGIHARTCVSMFMYITTRDMVNAAVRMNIVGPLEGGCLINELCSNLEILLNQLLTTADDGCTSNNLAERRTCDAAPNRTLLFTPHQVAPVVEILANAHDRLYTRLFNS